MRVLADSHAILWQSQGSPELSDVAADALLEAEETDGVVVSVASLADPWDRFIVATAKVLGIALVTKDAPIRDSGLVPTIW